MCSNYPSYHNVHDVQMSMMITWLHLSQVLKIVTCSLLHVVTLVTCGQMWSHLSHVVTLATCGHTCHMWSLLSQDINISLAEQKVHSLSGENTTNV